MLKTLGTHNYYVYLLTNKAKTVLYTGFTSDLKSRLYWHRNPEVNEKHFTARYKCFYLVYYEHFKDAETAIAREKQIKGWTRKKKEDLIAAVNPEWKFLSEDVEG